MGIYSEYMSKQMTFQQLREERKNQLKKISALREGRDIIVYASDLNNRANAPIGIDFSDTLLFQDQLSNLKGKAIDVIVETPGGIAEAVEEMVKLLRNKYEHIGIIIPGTAKSAGTIWAMAGDEILMGEASKLGPIDAQINTPSKRYSADAFLEGLEKIKQDVARENKLNPAYIPILQQISPGEIQHCENAQNFSKKLVTEWLAHFKFKFWEKHSSTGLDVTEEDKIERAKEIAEQLCKHSDWLTHSRSIFISDLEKMRLLIHDYSKTDKLNDAITRYYTLLRITLDSTNMYKLIETADSQVERFHNTQVPPQTQPGNVDHLILEVQCPIPTCKHVTKIQANFLDKVKQTPGTVPFPKNDMLFCSKCHSPINIASARLQIEAQTRKKVIT